jgi:hypothetical protein
LTGHEIRYFEAVLVEATLLRQPLILIQYIHEAFRAQGKIWPLAVLVTRRHIHPGLPHLTKATFLVTLIPLRQRSYEEWY